MESHPVFLHKDTIQPSNKVLAAIGAGKLRGGIARSIYHSIEFAPYISCYISVFFLLLLL
jgi:hypothetical protein